jgi:hypothetical protein
MMKKRIVRADRPAEGIKMPSHGCDMLDFVKLVSRT